jgi:hypothetical protein
MEEAKAHVAAKMHEVLRFAWMTVLFDDRTVR